MCVMSYVCVCVQLGMLGFFIYFGLLHGNKCVILNKIIQNGCDISRWIKMICGKMTAIRWKVALICLIAQTFRRYVRLNVDSQRITKKSK